MCGCSGIALSFFIIGPLSFTPELSLIQVYHFISFMFVHFLACYENPLMFSNSFRISSYQDLSPYGMIAAPLEVRPPIINIKNLAQTI